MKKILPLLVLGTLLISCSNAKNNSSSDNSNESSNSLLSSISSSLSSEETTSDDLNWGYIKQEDALSLIQNAYKIDIDNAHTSKMNLSYDGYDNGSKYHQDIVANETSYKNNITIGYGEVKDTRNENVINDSYTQVRILKDYLFFNVKNYKNNYFQNESAKKNILDYSIEEQAQMYELACGEVSCGSGYKALTDLIYVYQLGSSLYYSSSIINNIITIEIKADLENEQSNQKFISTYHYEFDSLLSGKLLRYNVDQAFYPLSTYNNAIDKSTVSPLYHSIENNEITFENLSTYEGDLPISLGDSFVTSITLSAAKTTIHVDEVLAIKADVLPETAEDKNLSFASSNTSIARVEPNGRIIGINEGECEITAINFASGVEGSIKITVIAKNKLDAGDDSKKGDLAKALKAGKKQILSHVAVAFPDYLGVEYSIPGMCLDSEASIEGKNFMDLNISNFAYDENLRKATYVGDDIQQVGEAFLPYEDNNNENLANSFKLKNSTIYHDVILNLEFYLDSDNVIAYIVVTARNDYDDTSTFKFNELTNENVNSKLTYKAGYSRNIVYENKGFIQDETSSENA